MAKLVFERALHTDPDDPNGLISYWPEQWPLLKLAKILGGEEGLGTAFFAASYQNDPTALEGNVLKTEWLQYYLPQDLEAARNAEHIRRGAVHCGIDPDNGGQGPDPDFASLAAIERIGRRAYLLPDFFMRRLPLESQAQTFESWLDLVAPNFCVVEDNTSKGYVYTALTTAANPLFDKDGNPIIDPNTGKQSFTGTKHPFSIEKPQGANAIGNKTVRFLSMAARFQNGYVLVPADPRSPEGQLRIHPRLEGWLDQWRSFPSGHDDGLDSTYWAVFSAFKIAAATSASKMPEGIAVSANMTDAERVDAMDKLAQVPVDIHGRSLQPIGAWRPTRQKLGLGLDQWRREGRQ